MHLSAHAQTQRKTKHSTSPSTSTLGTRSVMCRTPRRGGTELAYGATRLLRGCYAVCYAVCGTERAVLRAQAWSWRWC
eukprot:2795896-Rhodomonas_salina.1